MTASDGFASVDVRRQVETLKDDLSLLKDDLSSFMRDLVAAGKVEAGDAKDRVEASLRQRIDKLQKTASHLTDKAKSHGKDAIDSIETHAREKPLQTIAIALGIGVLLGAVLRR